MTTIRDYLEPDYEDYLDWLDEQPCERCYDQNKYCVCAILDERFGDIPKTIYDTDTDDTPTRLA